MQPSPGLSGALPIALSFLLGLALHPANWEGPRVTAVLVEPFEGGYKPGHELAEEEVLTETSTSTGGRWSGANLTRDCPDVEPEFLRVAGSGVSSTVQVPVVLTLGAVLGGEAYIGFLVACRWKRLAAAERRRAPLGEARLSFA